MSNSKLSAKGGSASGGKSQNSKLMLVILGVLIFSVLVGGYLFLSNRSTTSKDTNTSQERESSKIVLEKECSGELTPALTEGPYYKSGSPERTNVRGNSVGEKLTVSGYIFDPDCKPIVNAWIDFWQADGNGNYDNAGFNLRGHQFTDDSGKYVLETVLPARYSGRTPHIHVKVRANDQSPILTSQLFFPAESQNQRDSIFNESLLVEIRDSGDGKEATFNFVIQAN